MTGSRFAEAPPRPITAADRADLALFAASIRDVSRGTFAGGPEQARAPKGSPGGIGGEWLKTVRGWLADLTQGPRSTPPGEDIGGPLVESTGPRVLKSHVGMYDEHSPTSTGDDEAVPDVRNDEGMNHDDLAPDAVDPKGNPYGPENVARANEIHTQAILAERKLTEDMRTAMQGGNGELAGLEYRIKNQSSLAKKIRGNRAEGKSLESQVVTDNIKDAVRYTAVFDSADYTASSKAAIQRLRDMGYQVDIKSFYQGDEAGLAYKAIHGQMISPDGFKVELQFHTPEGLAAKFAPEMHAIYDKQKLVPKGSAEWEGYEQSMRDYMTGIGFTMPPGADTIN